MTNAAPLPQRITHIAVVVCLALGTATWASAACNLIPQAQPAFRGALGTLDRPYAAPGDFIDVNVRQSLCDGSSPGIGGAATQHEVTLLFTPIDGPKRAVVLTTEPCANLAGRLATCESASGLDSASCIQVNQPGDPLGMAVLFINGVNHLRFRFPDTDGLLAPAADRLGFTGPVTIAVTNAGAALPCGLATNTCAAQAGTLGLVACVDALYDADGTCQPNVADTFPSFTALPVANDFQADCYDTSPPCTASATNVRFAMDRGGNLLFPVHWQGVLPSNVDNPIPRLLRATVKSPVPIAIPDKVFLSSFTPEGQPLPPIFEPQKDPSLTTAGALALFGTADAPLTVLRIAHRRGRCVGGDDGAACQFDLQCGGGACVDACVGGANDGLACASKKQCPNGACGALFDATVFAGAGDDGGPIAIERVTPALPGFCQTALTACTSNADCAGAPCVSYAFRAEDPVALESLTAGTDAVLTLTAPETLALVDRTGDEDYTDIAITVRDRTTGKLQALGAPSGFSPGGAPLPACSLDGTPEGRAVVRVPAPPFSVTAVATEDDLVAFVESEQGERYCDENGDGDASDGILRVFAVPGGERTAGVTPARVVDPLPIVNGQSLAISDGTVFFRTSEAGMAAKGTERVVTATGLPGAEPDLGVYDARLSKTGRCVAFMSPAANLLGPGVDTNNATDAFVRDRVTGVVTRVSVDSAGTQVGDGLTYGFRASVSADGRYVAFDSSSPDLVPGDTNVCFGGPCSDIFVRDRDSDGNGTFDEPGGATTTRVSIGPGGVQGDGHSTRPVISANGRVVVFASDATNLVAGDTNGELDIFAHDLDSGVTERVDVANDGGENTVHQSETRVYDVSDDGRYVVFDLRTTTLPRGDGFPHQGPMIDVFMRDRVAARTEQLGVYDAQFSYQPQMSGDARWVAFTNEPLFNGTDIVLLDRSTGDTQIVSTLDGTSTTEGGSLSLLPSVSDDGRFVSFVSNQTNLTGPVPDTNGQYDIFVHDRLVGSLARVNLGPGNTPSVGDLAYFDSDMAADGREVLYLSAAGDLLGPPGDGNGTTDAFVRTLAAGDPANVDGLLFADGTLDDTVLETLAAGGAVTTLCPANEVAVANGRAAFLRPESVLGTAACPGGSLNLDADTDDRVVQLWPGSGAVENLDKAATAVALSSTHVAALVSEVGEGAVLNADGDTDDDVVAVRAISGGAWTNVGQAADRILFCGEVLAFVTAEAAQDATDLNGDTDPLDRVLQLFVPATGELIDVGQAVIEVVCNDQIVAFRTSEEEQGNTDLLVGSGPGDYPPTNVMQAYDLGRAECLTAGHPADCLGNSHRSALICNLAACDRRTPFRVDGTSVKFLAFECDQRGSLLGSCETPGTDLTGDLDTDDFVLQVFNVRAGVVTVLGPVGGDGDPLQGSAPPTTDTITYGDGRCIEDLGGPCVDSTQCGSGELCDAGTCLRDHGTCDDFWDCPPAVPCQYAPNVAASPDTDTDSVPDHLDDCRFAANPNQADGDADGVGDACDLATCGDGIKTYDEVCESGDDALCPGTCNACRCLVCSNLVADPKAKVQINTKKEAGQLSASLVIQLGSYTAEPVTIALSDGDSPLIVRETVGTVPPAGKAPFKKWVRKTKLKTGVVQIQLQKRPPSAPGAFKLSIKAKRWFTAAAANQLPASTDLTVTIGTQCFRIPVTKKSE